MIHTITQAEAERRELLAESIITTASLAASVATQTTINPGFRIALQDAVEALERLQLEASK